MENTVEPGRKIPLDTEIYCPYGTRKKGGNPDCDHDYDAKPTVSEDDYGMWKCTRCGMEVTFDVWD